MAGVCRESARSHPLPGLPGDEERAIEDPELAVLSAMAHAQDPTTDKSARIALVAQYGAPSAAVEAHVRATSSTELDRVAERVLTARTVEEALGTPCA